MIKFLSKRDYFAVFASVLLSVFMVAVVAYGASVVDTASVGAGTSTPGAAVGAKGAGVFDGFVSANYFTSTSSKTSWIMGKLGIGTTTPGSDLNDDGGLAVAGGALIGDYVHASYFGATSTTGVSWFWGKVGIGTTTPSSNLNDQGGLGVEGGAIIGDFLYTSYLTATSTTATSTIRNGMTLASTTVVDRMSGRWAIGTTTIPDADVSNTMSVDPGLTVSGVGSTNNATGTLYVAGGGADGGQIIMKSSDGNNCVALVATTGALDPNTDTAGTQLVSTLVSARVVACPK